MYYMCISLVWSVTPCTGWSPVGTARIVRGVAVLLVCACASRALSLLQALTTHLTALLSPSLSISLAVSIYIHIYIYVFHALSMRHTALLHISLSLAVYTYIHIYIYICMYMYILQALTVHHTPLLCLSLQASGAYQNSELACTVLSLYDTRGMMDTHRGMA